MDQLPLLPQLVAVFCLAVVVILICHRIRIPEIVGLLFTGVLCGPSALGLVSDLKTVEMLSDVGVVLLMFTIGMELSREELSRICRPMLVGGLSQVTLVVAAFTGLSVLIGRSPAEGIMFGFLAALSSTAIVLSLFQSKARNETPQARLSLAVLIFQDIATVPMMLIIPQLAGMNSGDPLSLLRSGLRTVAVLGGGWVLARHVVPWIMELVARTRSRDLMLLTTLSLCLAIAMGTAQLGLSVSLGAFLAGLLLAGSTYSLSELEGVLPFKTVFTSLFFISVGMLLDVGFAFEHLGRVVGTAVSLISLKTLLALPAMLLLGYPLRVCIIAALCLSQIGEFSFVLAKSGVRYGLIDQLAYQMFLSGTIVTMALTPVIMNFAPRWAEVVVRRLGRKEDKGEEISAPVGLKDHLIIVGFGVGGRFLARTARKTGIPYVILEMNPQTVRRCRGSEPIHHGDATRPLVLSHFGVERARVLTVVISDPLAVREIAAVARKLNPRLHIVARTRFLGEIPTLKEMGADDVIPEDFETAVEIFSRVLAHYLVPRQTIEGFVREIREENYAMARNLPVGGTSLPKLTDKALSGMEVSAVRVDEASAVAGKTLAETALRVRQGITVVGIRRGETVIASPDGTRRLLPGDTAYLFGAAAAVAKAYPLFSAPEDGGGNRVQEEDSAR